MNLTLFLLLLMLAACGTSPPEPGKVRARVELASSRAILQLENPILAGAQFRLLGQLSGRPLADGEFSSDPRFIRARDSLELLNLPESSRSFQLYSGQRWVVPLLERGLDYEFPLAKSSAHQDRKSLFVKILLLGLLASFGVITVFFTGAGAGGGIKGHAGETPLLLSLVHWVLFLVLASIWESGSYWAYFGMLMCATILASWSLGFNSAEAPRKTRTAQWGISLLYLGMFGLLLHGPDVSVMARWAGHGALEIYVPLQQRNRIELVGPAGEVLSSAALERDRETRIVYFWSDDREVAFVRNVDADGRTADLKLPQRP